MGKFNIEDFGKSLHTGFIDKSASFQIGLNQYNYVNRKIPRKKVLTTIINELENCESFYISVAFVP